MIMIMIVIIIAVFACFYDNSVLFLILVLALVFVFVFALDDVVAAFAAAVAALLLLLLLHSTAAFLFSNLWTNILINPLLSWWSPLQLPGCVAAWAWHWRPLGFVPLCSLGLPLLKGIFFHSRRL